MNDKVVVLTGASSGIGRAAAIELAGRGAQVILAARSKHKLENVLEEIKKRGGKAVAVECDVCSDEAVNRLIEETHKQFGRIDIAVLNAGVEFIDTVDRLNMAEVEQMFQTNVIGVIRCARAILPDMIKKSKGHIVVVSSIMGEGAFPHMVPYGASKGAVSSFARGLRREVAKHGIDVTVFLPGHTDTEISAHLKDRMPAWYGQSSGNLKPEFVAQRMVDAIKVQKKEIVIGRQSIMLSQLIRFLPSVADRIIKKITS